MSRQIITVLTDDLDGTEASETVQFAMDGIAFEIDLSDVNAKQLREVFAVTFQCALVSTRSIALPCGGTVPV